MTRIGKDIQEAVELLMNGDIVSIPTETVYGLAADATSDLAVSKIFKAKGRPSDNPLIVHIASKEQLLEITDHISTKAEKIIAAFWPGPLTIIFKKGQGLSEKVTAGLDSVGVRMPDHPISLEIIKQSGLPLAAPSANTSGKPSPTTAQHVYNDLKGKIPLIIDGGTTAVGVESTVIDCMVDPPIILRPGSITQTDLEAVIGPVKLDKALSAMSTPPRSPGMKYTHYAPQAPMYLVKEQGTVLQQSVNEAQMKGLRVGVLGTEESVPDYNADFVVACGSRNDLQTVAKKLYDALRSFDEHNLDIIFCETFSEEGIGKAIMNRLSKAANHKVI